MARRVFVLEEIVGILQTIGAPNRVIDAFRDKAESITDVKPEKAIDEIAVASGFALKARVGFVEFTLDDTRTQMNAKKARAVGLMLLEAAETATADEIFVKLLERVGVVDRERQGQILLDLRELRQSTRDTSWPS